MSDATSCTPSSWVSGATAPGPTGICFVMRPPTCLIVCRLVDLTYGRPPAMQQTYPVELRADEPTGNLELRTESWSLALRRDFLGANSSSLFIAVVGTGFCKTARALWQLNCPIPARPPCSTR